MSDPPLTNSTLVVSIHVKYFGSKVSMFDKDPPKPGAIVGEITARHGVNDRILIPTGLGPIYFVMDIDSPAKPRDITFRSRECDVEQYIRDLGNYVLVESFCDERAYIIEPRPQIQLGQGKKRRHMALSYYGVKRMFNHDAPNHYMIALHLNLAARAGCFNRVLTGYHYDFNMYREMYVECSDEEYKTVVYDEIAKFLKVVHVMEYNLDIK